MVQHFFYHLLFVHLIRIIGRPVIHLFQQRLVGSVAHKNMEVRGRFRPDDMVAELHKLRRRAAGILTLKQIANAFFALRIGQNFVAAVIIMATANRFALVELHHVIFNANGIHVRRIAFTIIGFHLVEGFAFILQRFLFNDRIQLSIQQEMINGLPGTVPV